MKSVVITGANGFIGQALIREFLKTDAKITAIVRNKNKLSSDILNNKQVEVYECPLDKLHTLSDKLKDERISAFYHLAWGGNSGPDRADLEIQLENVHGALSAFQFASSIGCDKFIGIGTITEFLVPFQTEYGLYSPNMKYVLTKDFTKQLLRIEALNTNMQFVWTRLGNTFGEGNETGNILDYTLKTLIKGEVPEYASADQPYDLIYIKDTARALMLMAENELKHPDYYIGSGSPRLLRDYLFEARDIIDKNLKIGIGMRPDDGLIYNIKWFDISKLKQDTSFTPEYSFADGVKLTVEHLKSK